MHYLVMPHYGHGSLGPWVHELSAAEAISEADVPRIQNVFRRGSAPGGALLCVRRRASSSSAGDARSGALA